MQLADVLAQGCCPELIELRVDAPYSAAVHARFVALKAGSCSADLCVGSKITTGTVDQAVAAIESRRCIKLD